MDNYMAKYLYPQDMGWDSIMPVDPEMSTEPAPSNTDDDNFDDEVENSPTVSFNDPSSDVNPAGERWPGHRWCCGKWKKDDGNFKRHLLTHNKKVPCEAEPLERKLCYELFADNKARNRHYRVSHKEYAKEHNIPIEDCFCELCGKSFSRRDNFQRHVDNKHSNEAEGEEGKKVIDDKYETIDCEDGEYARICRLRNTE